MKTHNIFKSPELLFPALCAWLGGLFLALLLFLVLVSQVKAQGLYASEERRAAAVGHYARARSLLLEALAEFERGRRIARPDSLVKADIWRSAIEQRAEELDRLLDPQPRTVRSGARFTESRALLRDVASTPRELNVGRSYPDLVEKPASSTNSSAQALGEELPGSSTAAKAAAPQSTENALLVESPAVGSLTNSAPAQSSPAEPKGAISKGEEEEISKAIDEAIKARVQKLSTERKIEDSP